MSQPSISVQLRRNEVELKLSSFEEPVRDALFERMKKLDFGTLSLGKMLITYGDPTKGSTYRYGIHLPKNVDPQQFTTQFIDQLRSIQFVDDTSFEINHLPEYEPIGE